jgi:hypothetical protein
MDLPKTIADLVRACSVRFTLPSPAASASGGSWPPPALALLDHLYTDTSKGGGSHEVIVSAGASSDAPALYSRAAGKLSSRQLVFRQPKFSETS